ncbi:MAG: hypothetical protein U5L96_08655 [Owenweeksia sp.]|nr:hypothetical protein [Owenweeksia sp.]
MGQDRDEKDELQIPLKAPRAPLFILAVLMLMLVILAAMPVAVTFFALTLGDGLHIGIGFSFLFCWGVGVYLLRIYLWNSVGREVLILNGAQVMSVADYGFFKVGHKEIRVDGLKVDILKETNNLRGRYRLCSMDDCIESTLKLEISALEYWKEKIEKYYHIS